MSRVYGFDEDGLRRIRQVVKRGERTPTTGAQRRRQPPVIGGGGGGNGPLAACPLQWIVILHPDELGFATSGDFSLDLTLPSDTHVSITVDFDDNAEEIETKLEAESDMLEDTELICTVSGGPLNIAGVVIRNKTTTGKRILEMLTSSSTLNRGVPYVLPMQPFTG